MNRAEYETYIECFNRGDVEAFGNWYTDDVLFELGDMREIHGLGEIVDFYRVARQRVRETQVPRQVVIDDAGVAAELESEFVALEDWPEFPSGPLERGDVYRRRGLIMYTLRDGKFCHIRSGRIRIIEGPWKR